MVETAWSDEYRDRFDDVVIYGMAHMHLFTGEFRQETLWHEHGFRLSDFMQGTYTDVPATYQNGKWVSEDVDVGRGVSLSDTACFLDWRSRQVLVRFSLGETQEIPAGCSFTVVWEGMEDE